MREASAVLQLIDLHMEELDPFFREFNVLHTEGAETGLNSFPAFLGASFNRMESGDSMVIILWLGGLSIFLFALLVLVLSLVGDKRKKLCKYIYTDAFCYQTYISWCYKSNIFVLVLTSKSKVCQKTSRCNCWSSSNRRVITWQVIEHRFRLIKYID